MKIIVTGSLGNISKPLTQTLVGQGHAVTVISSDSNKRTAIEALGATAAIGSIADVNFLVKAFTGADAVYGMIPLSYTDADPAGYLRRMAGNYGGEDRTVFVSPVDIADAVAEELLLRPDRTTIRYVGSEEMTCNEAAKILGTAIGKPWLRWVLISDKQMLQGLKMAKLPEKLCEMLVKMQATMHSGRALENFHRSHPKMGKVKLADFAKEFASVYHKQ